MKTCFKCGMRKFLDEFYEHPGMADGHLGKCKECAKADVKAAYQKANGRKEYERKRNQQPDRRRARVEAQRQKILVSPLKHRARQAVTNALRDRRLFREPCAICGVVKVEAHHTDYTKPLEVVWYCHKHHCEIEGRIAR